MSEYWISQGRKMCPYCKCWIADNRASINFHEQGKNHKENVKKKLDELRKKGIKDAKAKQAEVSTMAQIERAALESLKKDISSNPGIADVYGIPESKIEAVKEAIDTKISSAPPVAKTPAKKPKHFKKGHHHHHQKHVNENAASTSSTSNEPAHYWGDWYSAVNEEGYTYYWNTSTNETSWYPPEVETTNADGSDTAAADGSDPAADNSAPAADGSGQAETDASAPVATDGSEISAPATSTLEQPSETLSDTANTDEKKKEEAVVKPVISRKRGSAYGQWQVIKEVAMPDLQLPNDSSNFEVSAEEIPLPESSSRQREHKATEKKFKEKAVTLNTKASSNAPVTFKKRKFGSNRQARKQTDDDE